MHAQRADVGMPGGGCTLHTLRCNHHGQNLLGAEVLPAILPSAPQLRLKSGACVLVTQLKTARNHHQWLVLKLLQADPLS